MATLYITEFRAPGTTFGGDEMAIGMQPPLAEQTVAIGAATQSAAFSGDTQFIRVHADAICSIMIGSNPTATTAKMRMAADTTEYFGVVPGHKLSVITNT